MIIIYLLIVIALFLFVSLIFTNDGWLTYNTHERFNNYDSNNDSNSKLSFTNDTVFYERPEYRKPYRYPVGFLNKNISNHISSIHTYDINS